jgi:DNA repair protein RecO (recombination protein O)
MRDEMHLAFLLHRRDYRETSALADFFTVEHGVISGVVKGARGSIKSQRLPLQPFICLSISWQGHHDLKTIKSVEAVNNAPLLSGAQLFCGLYVNELLLRLLCYVVSKKKYYQCLVTALIFYMTVMESVLKIKLITCLKAIMDL